MSESTKQPAQGEERERFEAYAKDDGFSLARRPKLVDPGERYCNLHTHYAWKSWQARAALTPQSNATTAEQYIAAEIDRAPEPLKRLGKLLADWLDEDRFKTADALLLGGIEAANALTPQIGEAVAWQFRSLIGKHSTGEPKEGEHFVGGYWGVTGSWIPVSSEAQADQYNGRPGFEKRPLYLHPAQPAELHDKFVYAAQQVCGAFPLSENIEKYIYGLRKAGEAYHPKAMGWQALEQPAEQLESIPVDFVVESMPPLEGMDYICEHYKTTFNRTPDALMARVVEQTKHRLLHWWGMHREAIRAALSQPAEQSVSGDSDPLEGVRVCCGEYFSCRRPCTPRGRTLERAEAAERAAQLQADIAEMRKRGEPIEGQPAEQDGAKALTQWVAPNGQTLLQELEWAAAQYDSGERQETLSMRLYDVCTTIRALLSTKPDSINATPKG